MFDTGSVTGVEFVVDPEDPVVVVLFSTGTITDVVSDYTSQAIAP